METDLRKFELYKQCLKTDMLRIKKCIPKFEKACTRCKIRAVKTVRATMDEVEPLLKADPNFRLLHLYRDPRAVYRSRLLQRWTWSAYEMYDRKMWKTAQVYCQTVMHDYKTRRELERKYPGRIKNIVYDNFMLDPKSSRKKIYSFLDMDLESETVYENDGDLDDMLQINPRNVTNDRWKIEISEENVLQIEKTCQEFADLIGAKWRSDD